MSNFVHLHVRTEYSMLEGAIKLKPLFKKLPDLGFSALALTDIGTMMPAIEFQYLSKDAGIHPILGTELWVASDRMAPNTPAYPVVALCATLEEGYRNLCKIISLSHRESYLNGRPRVDRALISQYHEGLIFLSGGFESEIDRLLREGKLDRAREAASGWRDLAGEGNFYLEMNHHLLPDDDALCEAMATLGQELSIPLVATNSARCITREDHEVLEILACIRTGKRLDDPDLDKLPSREFHLKTADEMCQLFARWPEACDNTLAIAERCQAEIPTGAYFYPKFPLPEGFTNDDDYLSHISHEGLKTHYPDDDGTALKRLEYELEMMKKMKVAGYMLIVADFVRAAAELDIPVGPGRGSAVGSIVAYCTGITSVDPLKYALLFERFLNPERVTMPDIDTDFSDLDRGRIIQYVRDKYGASSVSQVITYGRLMSKAAFKDTARVLGLDHNQVNRLTKLFPPPDAGKPPSLEEAITNSPQLKEELEKPENANYKHAYETARKVEGYVRQTGVHAAAVIIAPDVVDHFAPLYCPEGKPNDVVVQYSKEYVENIGLLKMDFLGLRNLSVIQETCAFIKEEHGVDVDVGKLPDGDPETYAMLSRGDTVGVFQFESRGMQDYLRKLMPERMEDLIAMNALYRPGPMDQIPTFIRCKQGLEPIDCYHPDLEPILGTTYGVMVYQEQVMAIAQTLAGYTLGGADLLRRLMAKKAKEKLLHEEPKFVGGAIKRGYPKELAKKVWDLLIPFAAYAFNKSHAAAYAVVAYQTAWLKAHYCAEYLAANCNSELDKTERLVQLVDECKRQHIEVLAPDVQVSRAGFSVQHGKFVYGLAGIKNVGRSVAEAIVVERKQDGPYQDIFDLCRRIGTQALPRRALESLVMAGALDKLPGTRAQLFAAIPDAMQFAASNNGPKEQVSLFDMGGGDGGLELPPPTLPDIAPWSYEDVLGKEREVLGMYFSGHPLQPFRDDVEGLCVPLSAVVSDDPLPEEFVVGGLVRSCRTRLNKDNQQFAFVELEDFTGTCEVAFWTDAWRNASSEVEEGRMVMLRVKTRMRRMEASEDGNDETPPRRELEGLRAAPLSDARRALCDTVHISLDTRVLPPTLREKVETICAAHPGNCRLVMHVRSPSGTWLLEARAFRLDPSKETIEELRVELGPENVWISGRK